MYGFSQTFSNLGVISDEQSGRIDKLTLGFRQAANSLGQSFQLLQLLLLATHYHHHQQHA